MEIRTTQLMTQRLFRLLMLKVYLKSWNEQVAAKKRGDVATKPENESF